MIKTPLSTMIGGAFWTPSATILGSASKTFNQLIKSLFANNEQGFAYDPNDLSTMFQDATGTIPVTGEGQPVGLILDKSGRGNHASQTASASRPILRQNATTGAYYLEFDGSDDFLVTSNIDFTSTDEMSLFAGVHKYGASRGTILESNGGGFGRFILNSNRINSTSFSYLGENIAPFPSVQSDSLAVLTAKSDLQLTTHSITANGSTATASWGLQQSSVYQNLPLIIGRQSGGSFPFLGHIYSLIGVGRLTTDAETIALEKLIAKYTGVTLS